MFHWKVIHVLEQCDRNDRIFIFEGTIPLTVYIMQLFWCCQ